MLSVKCVNHLIEKRHCKNLRRLGTILYHIVNVIDDVQIHCESLS